MDNTEEIKKIVLKVIAGKQLTANERELFDKWSANNSTAFIDKIKNHPDYLGEKLKVVHDTKQRKELLRKNLWEKINALEN